MRFHISDVLIDQKLRLLFRTLLLLCVITVPFLRSTAQSTAHTDSLERELESIMPDSGKVNVLIEMSKIYLRQDIDKSKAFAEEALTLSREIAFQKGIAEAFYYKGRYQLQTGDLVEAERLFNDAKSIFAEINYSEGIARSLNNIGSVKLRQGDIEMAQSTYLEALKILKDTPGSEKDQAVTLNRLGNTYNRLNQFDKALKYFQSSLKIVEQLNYQSGIFSNLNNIGILYSKTKNYDSANWYYEKAFQLSKDNNDIKGMATFSSNLGSNYAFLGDYQKAVEYQLIALDYFQQMNYDVGAYNVVTNLGDNYFQAGQYGKALKFALQGLEFSKKSDNKELIIANQRTLAQIYAATNQHDKAYQLLMDHVQLKDSVYNDEITRITADMEAKYQNQLKTEEISLLEAENEVKALQIAKRENELTLLLILAVVAITLIGLLYNQFRIKQKANQKLKEINRLKSDFFANISHEFRTPLTLVMGPLSEKMKQASDEEKEELSIMYRNVNRLYELINQLLDLSKLEAGKLELNLQSRNINEDCRLAASSFSSLADYKQIEFETSFLDHDLWLQYDYDIIRKIANNLLSNAFKFTPENGHIKYSISRDNLSFMMNVEDSGPGIDKKDKEIIFERFHQTNNEKGGTGIGLALTKELTTLHGGSIAVKDSALGGASFQVNLPLQHGEVQPMPEPTNGMESVAAFPPTKQVRSNSAPVTEKPILLVIEDNTDLQNYLLKLLNKEYQVHVAENGKKGLEKALELVPDIIISDVMMPEMDGMEVCKILKQSDVTEHIPIIMLTALADQTNKLKGLAYGADDYLIKPFDADEVKLRVANFIKQQKRQKDKYSKLIYLKPSEIQIQNKEEAFIQSAIKVVEDNMENSEFTVENLARELGMSRMQLHRKLSSLTHQSASNFVRHLRLQRAADLLKTGNENVSQVSYAVGFSSLSYFTKSFKEEFGVAPSGYPKDN